MNVLPVLLLLLMQQLIAIPPTQADQTKIEGTPASSNVTKLSLVGSSNSTNNATILQAAKSANTSSDIANPLAVTKPVKVNATADHSPVLARGVTNTDKAPVQATNLKPPASTPGPQVTKSTTTTPIAEQTKSTVKTDKIVADGVSLSEIKNNNGNVNVNGNVSKNNNNNNSNSSTIATSTNTTKAAVINGTATNSSSIASTPTSTTPTTSTTTTTTTTTTSTTTSTTTPRTTTTTTARPKKPTVTSSMAKQIEGEKLDMSALNGGSVAPHVLPVQEMSSSSLVNRGENEYIVPIVTVMLAVPLAIAVFIVGYRRFRDLWTTRHYRRMDFLVDGMYND